MQSRQLGSTDIKVSALGFGGAEIGYTPNQNQATVTQMLNSALDSGLNLIDTAAAYGQSEQLIGNAISSRRKEVILTTKCGAINEFKDFDWSYTGILSTIEGSLKNLKTDYIDVVQLHSCDTDILLNSEAILALQKAVEKGYTRYIGYSGDGEAALTAIQVNEFDTLQTSISIFDQIALDSLIPEAKSKNIGVIVKRPLGNAVWRFENKPDNPYLQEYWLRHKKLNYNTSNYAETALRFLLSLNEVSSLIVGTTNPQRLLENIKYAELGNFTTEEFNAIRESWIKNKEVDWSQQT